MPFKTGQIVAIKQDIVLHDGHVLFEGAMGRVWALGAFTNDLAYVEFGKGVEYLAFAKEIVVIGEEE